MRNNRSILMFVALSIAALALFYRCTKELADRQEVSKLMTLQLCYDTLTISGAKDPDETYNEVIVGKTYVYIFNSDGRLENASSTVVVFDSEGHSSGDNQTWELKAGAKDIYVIVNPGTIRDAAGNAIDFSTYNPSTKAALTALRTDNSCFLTDFPAAGHAEGMLICGQVHITRDEALAVDQSGALRKTVPLARRYSRVDLSLRKDETMNGSTVVVESINLKGYSSQVMLFEPTPVWTGSATGVVQSASNLTEVIKSSADYGGSGSSYGGINYSPQLFSRYMMPRPASVSAQEANIPCLEVITTIDGTDKTYNIYLTELDAYCKFNMAKPLTIEPGKIYKVWATLKYSDMQIAITTVDWTVVSFENELE